MGTKSVVSSVDAITSTKGIIPNVRVEIFRPDDVRNKEQSLKDVQQSRTAVSNVITEVEPAKELAKEPAKETAEPAATEAVLVEAPVNNKLVPADTGKIKEVADISKDKVAKETKISSTINVSETQSAEKPVENLL